MDFFDRGQFPVVSTQAAVISTDFLRDTQITFVEGAAGQDTLFGWEVLAAARESAFTDQAYIMYYAERTDSVTNDVNIRYFEKALIMEAAQVKALRHYGLLEAYKHHHFDRFMNDWYLPRLGRLDLSDRKRAQDILGRISGLYGRVTSEVAARGKHRATTEG